MNQEQSVIALSNQATFLLSNFEGPLELLLVLIQKEEMDICDVALKEVTSQFFEDFERTASVERGAEFLAIATTLLLLKSRKLLPHSVETPQDEQEDLRFSLIQHLLEYCRFKEVAEGLSKREEKERIFFPRAAPPFEKSPRLGLEEISLSDLATLLQDIMQRACIHPMHVIADEEWHVAPKMEWLLQLVSLQGPQRFLSLFSEEKCRDELIVLFLALLELMKLQNVCLTKQAEELWIEHLPPSAHDARL